MNRTGLATRRMGTRFTRLRLLNGSCSAAALMAAVSATGATVNIVADSTTTTTTVTQTASDAATVTTSSISNGVGFNKFSSFNVATSQAATLVLPAGTNSLVNIVTGSAASVINGSVTSTLGAGGKTGGNLFFVVPSGLIIGQFGTINTGRLVVRGTPLTAGDTPALADVSGGAAASLIQVDGKINAPGGVDLKATTVTMAATGAINTGAAGMTAVPGVDADSLVSMAGLSTGNTIVARDGGISIVATGDVTLAASTLLNPGGATLDAKPTTYPTTATPPLKVLGGVTITAGGAISALGTITARAGTSADAGDITITTDKQALLGTSAVSALQDLCDCKSSATTSVTIGGIVTGGTVTIGSTATGSTDTTGFDAPKIAIDALKLGVESLLAKAVGLGLDAYVSLADATSGVTVNSGATVTAKGDLSITAASTVAGKAFARVAGTKTLGAATVYSQIAAHATTDIEGALTAGGVLTVSATNTAKSKAEAIATATDDATAAAFAYTDADIQAKVTVGSGVQLTGTSVTISAANQQAAATDGIVTNAATLTNGTGKSGGSAALTRQAIDATVSVAGGVEATTGSVSITSNTTTNHNINTASTSTGDGTVTDLKSALTGQDTASLVATGFAKFADKLKSDGAKAKPSKTEPTEDGTEKDPAKRLSAAVSVALVEQSATTSVTGTVKSALAATITGLVDDASVRNNASASAEATRKNSTGSDAIAGGAAWGDFDYTASATVGGTVTAGSLTVKADTMRPRGDNFDLSLPDPGSVADLLDWVKADVVPKVNGSLGVIKGYIGSSAGGSSKNNNPQATTIGGSFAYSKIDDTARAWIDQGAILKLGATLDVDATNTATLISLGGPISLMSGLVGVSSNGAAIGGAVAYSEVNPVTVAGIDSGVVLTRPTVAATAALIKASTTVDLLTLAPLAGTGGDSALTGTFAVNEINGVTHATISKDANLNLGTGSLTLNAATEMTLYAVAGSLAKTNADGSGNSDTAKAIGVSGALNLVRVDTVAKVGDASGDDVTPNIVPATAPTGGISADNVDAEAATTGSISAISVAGVVNKTTSGQPVPPPPPKDPPPKTASQPSALSKFGTAALTAAGVAFTKAAPAALTAYLAKRDADTRAKAAADAAFNATQKKEDLEKGSPVTKGFGAAGSASVNYAVLATKVDIAAAKFTAVTKTGATSFNALAGTGVDMLSVTGGAALATGKKPLAENTLIAGAYGLSYTANPTTTTLTDTTLDGFQGVDIQAVDNGSRIGAGLSLAVDATKTTDGKVVAAALSHIIDSDSVAATATGDTITGQSGGAGDLELLAYDGILVGAGAGGISYGASNGFGAALTIIDITSPNASNATLSGTTVKNFTNLGVRALNASRIIGIAAAGAVGTDPTSDTGALSLSLNLIKLDATAAVAVGALGLNAIDISGKLTVYSGDLADKQTEAVAGDAKTAATPASSFFDTYKISNFDLSSASEVSVADLQGGSQIFSVAFPLALSKGKAAGLALSLNQITNNRSATITGDAASSIHAGSIAASAVDRASILAVAAGIGGGDGGGIMGSLSLNQINGTSTASIDHSAGETGRFGVGIGTAGTTPPAVVAGTTPAPANLTIQTIGSANIFSLAGAVAVGKDAAGGLALGLNEIVRTSKATDAIAADDAGLHAGLNNVTLSGSPDISISSTSDGKITGIAFAGSASSSSSALAGAGSINRLAPVVVAEANNITYTDTSLGDLKIAASDSSTIASYAVTLAVAGGGAASAGVSLNTIDTQVAASLTASGTATAAAAITVRDLLIAATSTAKTTSVGVGVAAGSDFGGAGSLGLNTTNAQASALLSLDYANVTASGSVGVDATRDSTIDASAGVLAVSSGDIAVGASVVVNTVGGGASALVTGTAGHASTLTIAGGGSGVTGQRTGDSEALPQFDALNVFKDSDLAGLVTGKLTTDTVHGLSVNAASTHASRTIAITGAAAATGVGVAATAVVGDIGGTTTAAVTDTDVTVGTLGGGVSTLGIAVRASSQTIGATFAGAIAGGDAALAAPIVSDGFNATTTATITHGSIQTTGNIGVRAAANQSSTALALSVGLAEGFSGAVAVVSPRFQATTSALVDTPTALVANGADGFAVNATSAARAFATFGVLAGASSVAAAAAVVVATNENHTTATYDGKIDTSTGGTGLGSVVVDAPVILVKATGNYDAKVAGASVAAAGNGALVGNGIGIIHRGVVSALADGLNVTNPSAKVDVDASEIANFQPITGQAAIAVSPVSAGASLGVVVVLSQSTVDAELKRPLLDGIGHVGVDAYGVTGVDALQLGVAVGAVGIGANVTYIGVGKVEDTGALFAGGGSGQDDQVAANSGANKDGSNSNLSMLGSGGTSASDAAKPAANETDTTGATAGSTTSRAAFTDVKTADDAATARVRARITGSDVAPQTGNIEPQVNVSASGDVSVTSAANLVSKSSNYQLTAGLAAGSATIGITRNAANSIARIDSGVVASGGTLTVSATTGQDKSKLPGGVTNPTHAAEALVVGGSVGGLSLAVAYADVKLQTAAVAEVDGSIGFNKATIAATDTSDAVSSVIGVAAGALSANVAIAQAEKQGTVGALFAGVSNSNSLTITADGGGKTSADTIAASGGALFGGNAAVALAQDSRTVSATVAEKAVVLADTMLLKATATPDLSAHSFGIAVSGGVAIGASLATATSDTTVTAQVGEGATLGCFFFCSTADKFTVEADILRGSGYNISAVASGSAGGALLGLNATVARANNIGTVKADVGADLPDPSSKPADIAADQAALSSDPTIIGAVPLSVIASRDISQYSEANGITASLILAIGAQDAKSTSSGTVEASVTHVDGSNRVITSGNVAALTVSASSNDVNEAKAVAGAGGIGAGVAAIAATESDSVVTATVAPDPTKITVPAVYSGTTLITPATVVATPLQAGALKVTATSATDYKATTDATQASLVGGSGSTNDNKVNTSATVNLGQNLGTGTAQGSNSRIEASSIKIAASDTVGSTASQDAGSATGAGGGVVTGAAALIANDVTQAATVNIYDGTVLRQYGGDPTLNTVATFIDASIETDRSDTASLKVGGVMELPFGKIRSNYTANTAINIDANVLIRADQGVGIGTVASQQLKDTEATQIYGLAGIGGGSTDVETNVKQTVTVKDGATIEGMGDVRVAAGTSGDGNTHSLVTTSAQTDVFNWTLLPISVDHGATAVSNVTNTLDLGSATIRSARDVSLSALTGAVDAGAVGTGHNPYLKALAALGISLTDTNGNASTSHVGTIKLDGTQVTGGFLAHRTIAITGSGTAWSANETDNDGRTDTVTTIGSPGASTVPKDPLGRYGLFSTDQNSADIVAGQIATLQAKVGAIEDPNTVFDTAAKPTAHEDSQASLDAKAASSADIAQLSLLYDTQAALKDTSSGTSPTAGVYITGVFAAGGLVGIDADKITGTSRAASIVANTSPTITITNNSARNTVLGNFFIPSKPAGAVTYGGAATEASLTAITASIVKAVGDATPDGLISITNGVPFSSKRTDVIDIGKITNVGGALKVLVNNGNYAQFGLVEVGSFSADVPNGVFSVSEPGSPYSQGLPIDLYYGNLGWSLYAKTALVGPKLGANDAATLVASFIGENAFSDSQGSIGDGSNGLARLQAAIYAYYTRTVAGVTTHDVAANADPIYSLFLDGAYRLDFAGRHDQKKPNYSVASTIFGGCAFYSCELESDDDQLNSVFGHGQEARAVYDPGRTYYTPATYFTDPVQQLALNAAVLAAAYPTVGGGGAKSGGAIDAVQVKINAATVDISGTIIAGPKKARSLIINNADALIKAAVIGADGTSDPLQTLDLDPTGKVSALASGNIGVRYVAAGNYLQVDDVAAGAGGAIDITGRILNTNPLGGGKLKVLDGFANISVVNNSGLDVHLGTLNAGANVSGRIKLVDKGSDSNGNTTVETTIWRNTPGKPVTIDHSFNDGQGTTTTDPTVNATVDNSKGLGTSDGSAIVYTPRGSAYYTFTEGRDLIRSEDYYYFGHPKDWGGYTTIAETASVWAYSNTGGQAPQGGGSYVDLNDGSAGSTQLKGALGSARPDTVQLASGYVTVGNVYPGYSDVIDRPITRNNSADRFVVTGLHIDIKTAVKATYPIKLVFDANSVAGGLSVTSLGGGIVVGGQITYAGGTVSLVTNKAITATSDGAILANGLTAQSDDGIGSAAIAASAGVVAKAAAPLVVALAGSDPSGTGKTGGTLNASAVNGSLYLDLTSTTTTNGALDSILLGSAYAPGGTVSIKTNGGLLGTDGGANIVANDIALTTGGSVAGAGAAASADPLLKRALLIQLGTGKLDVTAGGDVTIEAANPAGTPGDVRLASQLKLGAIVAQGDVLLRGWGSIVAASNDTVVDPDKLARLLASQKALQLDPTSAKGVQCAAGQANCVIIPSKLAAVENAVRDQARAAYDVVAQTTGTTNTAAVATALTEIGAINALVAQGVTLSTGWQVSLSAAALADPVLRAEAAGALPGGIKGALPTDAEVLLGLQAYVDTARTPLIQLLGRGSTAAILPLTTLAEISAALPSTTPANANLAYALDAFGKIGIIDGLTGEGVSLSSTWQVSLSAAALADPKLRTLALDTLHTLNNLHPVDGSLPGVENENVTLPSDADVTRGIQAYIDKLRVPLTALFATATPATLEALTTLDQVKSAIPVAGYALAQNADRDTATATLTQIFGYVPSDRSQIGTLAFAKDYFAARSDGAMWNQGQLDFAVPSTAFVPVADTQFETRAPVITARKVTLIAGNNIGNFADPQTFTFTADGLVDSTGTVITGQQKDLAAAYLASAGPGDLAVAFGYQTPGVATTAITSVAFTTRRDQPLQLDASGTVNALAATDIGTLGTTATPGSAVTGDIFLSNRNDFKIGTIVSQKGRTAVAADGCNTTVGASISGCDSRIHLQGNSLIGVTSGAAQLISNGSRLSNADGRAIVMGGLVRLEASNGTLASDDAIPATANTPGSPGTAILIDARALETVRSAGNVVLAKRQPVGIPFANPADGGTFSFPNDLVLGDTFAANTLTLDNPYGSFFVGALPSSIASEDRNSRIVAGTLEIRAAGDIGADGDNLLTGRSNQLDIQAPRIRIFVAGYDYSGVTGLNFGAGKVGVGPAPSGLPEGDGFFALRGVSTIGGDGSVLGARNDITIGAVADYTNHAPPPAGAGNGIGITDPNAVPSIASSIDVESSIQIGGAMNLTTDGSLRFGPDVNISSLGKSARSDCATNPTVAGCELDLSRLHLNLKGTFDITTPRSLLLGSLSAGGGTIESTLGYVDIIGTLFGVGGPATPFTVKGLTGVTAGAVGNGAVALISDRGNVEITGTAFAADLTLTGVNVSLDRGSFGRSLTICTLRGGCGAGSLPGGDIGHITLGGPVYVSRTAGLPDLAASLTAIGGTIIGNDLIGSSDALTLTAARIELGANTLITGGAATKAVLTAQDLIIDPAALAAGLGELDIVQTQIMRGAYRTVVLPIFNGGTLNVVARGDIVAGRIAATGDVTLQAATIDSGKGSPAAGTVTLGDRVDTAGALTIDRVVDGTAGSLVALTFGANGDISSSASADLRAATIISTGHRIVTSGALNLVSASSVNLRTLSAGSGVVRLTPAAGAAAASLTVTGALAVTGGDLALIANGDLSLHDAAITGTLDTSLFNTVAVSGAVTVTKANPGDALNLNAKGAVTLAKTGSITGTNTGASVNVSGGSIAFDPAATVRNTSFNATSNGAIGTGAVLANALTQTVTIRGGGAVTTKALSGAAVTVASSLGAVTIGGPITGGRVTLTAAQDLITTGIAATSAQLSSSYGSATLSGITRLNTPGVPSAATLTVTAAKTITIDGATSAAGGMSLSAPTIVTTTRGYLTDLDHPGALTSLRAQTVNVAFNTGASTGTALHISLRGLSTTNTGDATLVFASLRPVTFDLLYADRTTLTASTALTISKLNMADWMLFKMPAQTIALQGGKTPPAAARTIVTGALTAAKLVVAPGVLPSVNINGTMR